ncbi:rod-binding protein [Aurantimonas sp. 22II-16-19i]|uniref:rod-binding protein n=1 Tax=Aurantimonas sp. 22II-16-19i TaxID=1317114 RepID=UPI0009F7C8EE|nr:rod-binding protein [Aurantimonas sp. 22II-16-19i]ORE97985.1 hypothetical protein ATO4_05309 [Aurantimonas sp. 22II-16-19i]
MTVSTDFSINPLAPAKLQADTRMARPAAAEATGESFSAAMATARGSAAPGAGAGSASAGASPDAPQAETTIRPLVKHEARKAPPLEQFEGFVLRTFIESMLPSENSAFFGEGTAGSIWRSMMAEEIGNEIAKAGGIGIADTIARKDDPSVGDRARADVRAEVAAEIKDGISQLRAEDGADAMATLGARKPGL